MAASIQYTNLTNESADDASKTPSSPHLPLEGDRLLYASSVNHIQTDKLKKYPHYTPRFTNTTTYHQKTPESNYNVRKKTSPCKQLATNLTPTFCRVSVAKMSAFNVHAFKFVKLISTYFLFVFLPVFFVVAMVQAYKCVHKFNINQLQLHASVRSLNQNYKYYLLTGSNNTLG